VAITTATLREVERLRRQLLQLTDAQTLALTRAWAEAWDVLLPEYELAITELVASAVDGKVSRAAVARSVRLQGALQQTRTLLDVLAPGSADIVSTGVSQAVMDAVDGHEALVRTQLPPNSASAGVSWLRVPEEALTAIVERTTGQIHSNFLPLADDVERTMKRQLIRGIAAGTHPSKTAKRIIKETEGRFNGGLTRALNIAQTETLDAYRGATKAADKANREVLAEWEWNAKLDRRTCPSCLSQHGSRHPLEDDGPLDHQQGRCARVPVTKTWKELGFDIPEPPSSTPNAEAWFNNLTPATQAEIMGPTRLQLLQSGDISWADLSSKRSTSGWRDSYGVTPVKDLVK
jgi:SPP1 gp7 family putative phage head morphogenesis protein